MILTVLILTGLILTGLILTGRSPTIYRMLAERQSLSRRC